MKNNYSVNRASLCTKTQSLVLHEIFTSPDKGWTCRNKLWIQVKLRDPQQITFVMLNRFWSLSKSLFTPFPPSSPFLMGNIRLYRMITLPVFLFLVLHQFLNQQIPFSQLSRTSFNIIWKKSVAPNFPFLMDSHPPPNPTTLMAKIC